MFMVFSPSFGMLFWSGGYKWWKNVEIGQKGETKWNGGIESGVRVVICEETGNGLHDAVNKQLIKWLHQEHKVENSRA